MSRRCTNSPPRPVARYLLHEDTYSNHRLLGATAGLSTRANFSITPSSHTSYNNFAFVRDTRGVLVRRQPEPLRRSALTRWRWRVLLHRPRLWHFWRMRLDRLRPPGCDPDELAIEVLVGTTDRRRYPFLDLLYCSRPRPRCFHLEAAWLPHQGHAPRRAPAALLQRTLIVGFRGLWLEAGVQVCPGWRYSLYVEIGRKKALP